MTSPDMIWRECPDCERAYTLADTTDSDECPHCNPDVLSGVDWDA